jgi:hypothetical protein
MIHLRREQRERDPEQRPQYRIRREDRGCVEQVGVDQVVLHAHVDPDFVLVSTRRAWEGGKLGGAYEDGEEDEDHPEPKGG